MYDARESKRLKDAGMLKAAKNRKYLLEIARTIARRIALAGGGVSTTQPLTGKMDLCVTADDVGAEMEAKGYPDLGPAAGSIFKTKEWVWTGHRIRSNKISNHARELRVWRLLV